MSAPKTSQKQKVLAGGEPMAPYYDADGITIYHGDCREIWPAIRVGAPDPFLLTDPPYGIAYRDRTGRTINGDDVAFDPLPWVEFPKVVLWGAENFAHLLPPSRGWLVWSKVQDQKLADNRASVSNVELAWSNLAATPQLFNHYWRDWIRRASERGERLHPAQKPVALFKWILDRWSDPYEYILDPFMGSGPIAKACHEMNRGYIGIEIEEKYCEIAVQRLAQGVLEFS